MIKKKLTYMNVDGEVVTDDFYFNLSMNDLLEKSLSETFTADLKLISAGGMPNSELMRIFTTIIGNTVGRRSESGMGLVKSEEFTNEFLNSDAYSVLILELLTNAKFTTEFINGIVPSELAKKMAASGAFELPEAPAPKKPEEYTLDELLEMTKEEYTTILNGIKGSNVPKPFLLAGRYHSK